MKKNRVRICRRLASLVMTLMLLTGILTVGASAASTTTVTGTLRPDVTIVVDGAERTFYNVQGKEVHPVLYNGTHYLPLRAIGELMGKNVNWDQSTLTVTLSGTRTAAANQGTPDRTTKEQEISVQIRPDFTIVVDNAKRTFANEQGNTVHPMLHSGSTYLPIRAIGELMGKTVSWNGQTKTITLAAPEAPLVTDADTFGPEDPLVTDADSYTQGGQQAIQSGTQLTAEEAKSKALTHAGLTANQATFVKARLDRDDGRQHYEVEFYTADYKEYDYDIDAYTGAVLSFDYDAEEYKRPAPGSAATTTDLIGEAKAKSIALEAAGFTESQVSRLRCHLDRDDGRYEYNVEFVQGTREYEFEIDAYSGTIRSRDTDSIYD